MTKSPSRTTLARTALASALALALTAIAAVGSAATLIDAAQPSVAAVDAARGNPNLIILRAGVFDPATQMLATQNVGAASNAASAYAIVQFQPGRLGKRKALAARGVEFLGYVPNNAYYVRLNGVSLAALTHDSAVRWAGPMEPAMKLDPTLWQARRVDSSAKQADSRYEVQIDAFSGVSSANIAAALEKRVPGVRIVQRNERADSAAYVRAAVMETELLVEAYANARPAQRVVTGVRRQKYWR